MSAENIDLVRRWMDEAWNQHSVKVEDYCSEECVVRDPGFGELRGPDGLRQFVDAIYKSFRDTQATIDDLIATGDRVVVRLTVTATHLGPFMEFEATGKRIHITAIVIIRIRDGKFVEAWQEWDALGVRQQIAAPSQDAAAAAGAGS